MNEAEKQSREDEMKRSYTKGDREEGRNGKKK